MKKILFIISLICSVTLGLAQNTIESYVSSNEVGVGEIFTFEIVVNSQNCPVNQPNFGELEVVGGPNTSQKNTTSNVNGVVEQKSEIIWSYQLRAPKIGNYTISGVVMTCGRKKISSNPIEVKVIEGSANPVDRNFYMELTTNKSSVYEGEPFILTLKYFARNQPKSIEGLELGDAAGLFREDVNPNRESFLLEQTRINGMMYYTIVLREEICFAQRSGTVKIAPYYAILTFQNGNIFNQFSKETYSNSLEIQVKEIPIENTPDYSGLVGDFSIASEISKNKVAIGDAIDIKITISGEGNFNAVGDLKLAIPNEFNSYEPTVEQDTKSTRSGMKGSISYNFAIIPTRPGDYEIPAYTFSYFDLDKKKMQQVSTETFKIKVEGKDGLIIDPIKETIEKEAVDIRYIETENPNFFRDEDLIFGTWTYGIALTSPLLLSFLFIFWNRKKENITDEDKLKLEQKNAIKEAQMALKLIRTAADAGENAKALKGLQSLLNNFFKLKFNVGLSELSQRSIDQRLLNLNIDEQLRTRFNAVWNTIEMGQYAPIAHENLVHTVNQTEELLLALDKSI